MIKNIRLFLKLLKNFGFQGIYIFIKLKMNFTGKIKLHKIKHIIYLRKNTSDINTFYQIFLNHEYDIKFDFDPKVIIDAGANIGLATIFYKNKYKNSIIIAIEPEKSNFDILKKNTTKYENVFLYHNALFNFYGKNMKIIDKGLGKWGFMTQPNRDSDKNSSISSITIDYIMKKQNLNKIDILKIDIEGSEKYLFESNFENWLPKTKYIIIEFHERMVQGSSVNFFNAISKFGFSYIDNIGENLIFFNNKDL